MTISAIQVGILHYPGALLSAVQGMAEQFYLANKICHQNGLGDVFQTYIFDSRQLSNPLNQPAGELQVIILPPCLDDRSYLAPENVVTDWVKQHHQNGSIICSVCAGAFVLAKTGLLKGRRVTTHWALAEEFARLYPETEIDCNKLLINDGDIITAGGLMSWIDLGLELVAQFTNTQVMRQLGKYLIVDTGPREQSYYRSFTPRLDHGDEIIVRVQHQLQRNFNNPIMVKAMAQQAHLSERTFLRRFVAATGLKPTQYLQQLRIQKACELIEASGMSFEKVAEGVGYEDLSAFRKTFIKITGQTPKEFRKRFFRAAPASAETQKQ
ncbi:GlxA family transcriptional regulator [Marinobacter zhejiangensis]|uniref:Transcriptional regulator GlxA family, contains an amidase domain and an AraC-type DNA-binding HTH domain n=1 Tax=Marinobacter zhejiangensis TaxID=488535 RepID=A0A1I4MGS0_9GAMM|nr:helix-turn-helix domain-containing protein [Marinobacter zhejiangensis]SFM02622.1 Transcriptional regulator GlxA family, contains an amidase domain and an AraC-type DNA-binding HTH domain [Marinobacter zhejiangensis]